MRVFKLDPVSDSRWPLFLARQPKASVFHTPGWLEGLRRTYGYEPVAFTTSPPASELTDGIVFCRIASWLTGRRMVCLPCSDHCHPLVYERDEVDSISGELKREAHQDRCRYIEIRPATAEWNAPSGFGNAKRYYFHRLDLRPPLDQLFESFHKDCVRRKIRRAERESLTDEEGRSEPLLKKFYHLFLLTRRRHGLPPQPVEWFRNLTDCMADSLKIRVASKDERPVASILTLNYKDTLVYKYGASDARLNSLGGTQLLFWKAIQEARREGLRDFDMGRSDCDQPGLIAFKERWGATQSVGTYLRYPAPHSLTEGESLQFRMAKQIFAHAPDRLLTAAGRALYRHIN